MKRWMYGQELWGLIPQVAAANSGVLDVCTGSFQGDTGDLVLLLEQAGGRRPGSGHQFHWLLGRLAASTLMPAKLETWPSGSRF